MRSAAPSRRLARLGAIPLLFLTLLGLVVGGLSAPAVAAPGDAITVSGVVTRTVDGAMTVEGGVRVDAFVREDLTTPVATVMQTPADGTFALTGLTERAAGSGYKIRFSGQGIDPVWFASNGAVPDPANATVVNASSSAIDATITYAPVSISGEVTNAQGQAIQGITVALQTRQVVQNGATTYSPVATAPTTVTTSGAGTYSFTVRPGSYVVSFSGSGFGTAYVDGVSQDEAALVSDRDAADPVVVAKGTPRTINASLTASPLITGVVRDSAGNPIVGVRLTAEVRTQQQDGSVNYGAGPVASGSTQADGSFSLDVPDGAYVVGYDTDGYVNVFWNGAGQAPTTNKDAARLVTVSAGSPQDASATLTLRAATVSGRARAVDGSGLAGVTVTPLRYQAPPAPGQADRGTWVPLPNAPSTITDDDGRYKLVVPPGVRFRLGFDSADTAREDRFFPSATVADEAANITVTEGQSLTGYDVTLPFLGSLRGSLTEPNGATFVGEGTVQAFRRIDYTELGEQGGLAHSEWVAVGAPVSLSNGSFLLRLPADSYRLKAVLSGNEQGFLPGLVGLDEAPDVTLVNEANLTGQQYRLPPRRTLSGIVRDAGGTPQSGATAGVRYRYVEDIVDGLVVLSDWIEPQGVSRQVLTQTDGSFSLQLRERRYQAFASPAGQPGARTYFGPPNASEAGAVSIPVDGEDVTGIDITFSTVGILNTVRPWVSGLADPGSTLTANTGSWSPGDVSLSTQWQYLPVGADPAVEASWQTVTRNAGGDASPSGFGTPSANGQTFSIPNDNPLTCPLFNTGCAPDVAYRIRVTGSRPGSTPAAVTVSSKPTGRILSGPAPDRENRRIPLVSGAAATGQVLSTDNGVWAEQTSYTYQWLADNVAIPSATSSTFTLTPAQVGRRISVRVTPAGTASATSVDSAQTVVVARGQLVSTVKPSITGSEQVGATLTAVPGTWNVPSPTFGYQWLANGQEIPGATARTYVPLASDLGKALTVRVTANAEGYTAGRALSDSTRPIAEDPTKVTNRTLPVISGTAKVGEVLTTTEGTWSNQPTSFTYQWAADGTPVAGATARTLTLAAEQAGKRITVTVTAAKTGLTSGQATSAQTALVAPADGTDPETCEIIVTGGPSVSGTPAVGNVLAVTNGTTTPDGVTATYQWLRGGVPIPGATGATYRVVTADEGSALAVRVTYRKTDCADVVRTVQAGTVPRDEPTDPVKPRIDTVKKIKGSKFVLRVTVTASTQDPVQGALVLKEGSKRLAGGMLNSEGKRKLVVRGLKKGFHSLRLTYQGNDLVREGSKTFTFTIR